MTLNVSFNVQPYNWNDLSKSRKGATLWFEATKQIEILNAECNHNSWYVPARSSQQPWIVICFPVVRTLQSIQERVGIPNSSLYPIALMKLNLTNLYPIWSNLFFLCNLLKTDQMTHQSMVPRPWIGNQLREFYHIAMHHVAILLPSRSNISLSNVYHFLQYLFHWVSLFFPLWSLNSNLHWLIIWAFQMERGAYKWIAGS